MYVSAVCSVLLFVVAQPAVRARSVEDHNYNASRASLIKREADMALGSKLHLTPDESKVNEILMNYKRQELDNSLNNPHYFNMSKHYFTYKKDIPQSKVYQIIKRMPKGAVLHVHTSYMLNADAFLNFTYEDHLYACFETDNIKFRFADKVPERPCSGEWRLLSDIRAASDNIEELDARIKKMFTLYTEDKNEYELNVNAMWNRFRKIYEAIKPIIAYKPVREKYVWQMLKNYYDDNVMYIEMRGVMKNLHELDGTTYDKMYMAKLYIDIVEKFMKQYPDFRGAKIVLSWSRSKSYEEVQEYINISKEFKKEMPDFIAGFDLAGQEDLGKPLKDFVPLLLESKNSLDFFFHGGETNWYGSDSDENLFDAVLLGSKRIGHAYSLVKHPVLMSDVKTKKIALEVNVISNVVLSLVSDVRNHPLAIFLAKGLPVVLSSDDPGAWEADPASTDFYVAFVGVMSRQADLRVLKQLARNSIHFSSLNSEEKRKLFEVFNRRWDTFIKETIQTYS